MRSGFCELLLVFLFLSAGQTDNGVTEDSLSSTLGFGGGQVLAVLGGGDKIYLDR